MEPRKPCCGLQPFFALAHFFNLVMNPNFLPVFANVIQAFMIGLYLAAIYVLSKNLIAPSIVHGLIDFASFIFLRHPLPRGTFENDE